MINENMSSIEQESPVKHIMTDQNQEDLDCQKKGGHNDLRQGLQLDTGKGTFKNMLNDPQEQEVEEAKENKN